MSGDLHLFFTDGVYLGSRMEHLFVVIAGQYLFLPVILGFLVAWIRSPRDCKPRFFLSVLVAAAVAYGLSLVAAQIHYDTRPFVAQHLAPLFPHAPDNGFPSDHALFTMTLAAITFFFDKRVSVLMLVFTALVGVGRVMALVHSPEDILAGWALGVVGAVVGYYTIRALWPRVGHRAPHRPPRESRYTV